MWCSVSASKAAAAESLRRSKVYRIDMYVNQVRTPPHIHREGSCTTSSTITSSHCPHPSLPDATRHPAPSSSQLCVFVLCVSPIGVACVEYDWGGGPCSCGTGVVLPTGHARRTAHCTRHTDTTDRGKDPFPTRTTHWPLPLTPSSQHSTQDIAPLIPSSCPVTMTPLYAVLSLCCGVVCVVDA